MKDKYKNEIKAGDLVKRCGYVEYADGRRFKISKNTWLISRVEGKKLFFTETIKDTLGNAVQSERELQRPKDEGDFIVVGDAKKGLRPEFKEKLKVVKLGAGSVAENYRVLKDVPDKNWKVGEIVQIFGKVAFETLEKGWLEKVDKEMPHKHVLIVVDPISLNNRVNN